MRLFDAIIEQNHRAVKSGKRGVIPLAKYSNELPIVAMTCIDPRLNKFFPKVMGLADDTFIWLRNAGNVITGPLSSMTRSIALACAVKGGREIVLIGHTNCAICHTNITDLQVKFRALGIGRDRLPKDLNEYFGVFACERDNVITGVNVLRQSPLIGPKIPVQGLLVDVNTGKLEWVVNGYDALKHPPSTTKPIPIPDSATVFGTAADLRAYKPQKSRAKRNALGQRKV